MTRSTTSDTAPSPTAVVWADGDLFTDGPWPEPVRSLLGVELGLSPVSHVHAGTHVEAHLRVLGAAAAALGYEGFDAASVRTRLQSLADGCARVALVPTPESHRAMPPGEAWSIVVEPFEPSAGWHAVAPLRVAVGAYRRNQTSLAANLLLLDDTELCAGAVSTPDADATVWLDLDGHVACLDQHCVVARLDGRLVTPSLDHGAIRTAPRHVLVTSAGGASLDRVTEVDLDLEALRHASAVVGVSPWETVHRVAELDGHTYDTADGEALVASVRALLGERSR